jgi:hypothetical protein
MTSTRSRLTGSGWVGDDDGAVKAAEYLVGNQPVVVRVVPIHPRRMIVGQLYVVAVRPTGLDFDERIVAVIARRYVQPVGMQVGRIG